MLQNALFFLSEVVKNSVNALMNYGNRSIVQERKRRALKSTVDFIEQNFGDRSDSCFNQRNEIIKYAVKRAKSKGLWMEFGVYKGASVNYIAQQIPQKRVYGFDSFEGLPENWRAGFNKNSFSVPELPAVEPNVTLIKGLFSKSIATFLKRKIIKGQKASFIHIDCDLYSSTKVVFDKLEDKIQKGTIILFDEFFNYPGWQNGEYKALREFVSRKKLKIKYLGYCGYGEQVVLKIL